MINFRTLYLLTIIKGGYIKEIISYNYKEVYVEEKDRDIHWQAA